MSDSPLRVSLTEVKEDGSAPVDVLAPPEDFPDALEGGTLVGPVRVKGLIAAVEDDAVFEGSATGRWRFECTRCLEPVEQTYASPVEQTVKLEQGSMDLADEVRQAIALAQPMKIYCKPDCKGLCPVCRKNRNKGDCGHKEQVAQGDDARTTKPRLTPRHKKG